MAYFISRCYGLRPYIRNIFDVMLAFWRELGPKMWKCQQFIALILLGTLVSSQSLLCKECIGKSLERVRQTIRDIISPPGLNPPTLLEVQPPKVVVTPESSRVIHVHQPQLIVKPIFYPKIDSISLNNEVGVERPVATFPTFQKQLEQKQFQNNNVNIRLDVDGLKEGTKNALIESSGSPRLDINGKLYTDSQSQSQSQSQSESESQSQSQSQSQSESGSKTSSQFQSQAQVKQNNRQFKTPLVLEILTKALLDSESLTNSLMLSQREQEAKVKRHLQILRNLLLKEVTTQWAANPDLTQLPTFPRSQADLHAQAQQQSQGQQQSQAQTQQQSQAQAQQQQQQQQQQQSQSQAQQQQTQAQTQQQSQQRSQQQSQSQLQLQSQSQIQLQLGKDIQTQLRTLENLLKKQLNDKSAAQSSSQYKLQNKLLLELLSVQIAKIGEPPQEIPLEPIFVLQLDAQLKREIQLLFLKLWQVQENRLVEDSRSNVAEHIKSNYELFGMLNAKIMVQSPSKFKLLDQIMLRIRRFENVQQNRSRVQLSSQIKRKILLQLRNLQLWHNLHTKLKNFETNSLLLRPSKLLRDLNLQAMLKTKQLIEKIQQSLRDEHAVLLPESQRQIHAIYLYVLQLSLDLFSYDLQQLQLKELEFQKKEVIGGLEIRIGRPEIGIGRPDRVYQGNLLDRLEGSGTRPNRPNGFFGGRNQDRVPGQPQTLEFIIDWPSIPVSQGREAGKGNSTLLDQSISKSKTESSSHTSSHSSSSNSSSNVESKIREYVPLNVVSG